MGNIDRADWHHGVAWIIHRGLGSKSLQQYGGDMYQRVLGRTATGRDLLFSELDQKFFAELLSREGEAFTRDYYESDEYLNDYDQTLGGTLDTLYHVADSWENYDRIAPTLDRCLEKWRSIR